jgi:hypothetical protein
MAQILVMDVKLRSFPSIMRVLLSAGNKFQILDEFGFVPLQEILPYLVYLLYGFYMMHACIMNILKSLFMLLSDLLHYYQSSEMI